MPRTTAILVGKIVDLDPTLDVDSAIEAANSLVTSVCATALMDDGVTPYYAAARLELIERYLSAHFYCVNDAKTKREKVGRVMVETQSKVDLGFSVTHYGQQAMLLDERGGLAGLNSQVVNSKGRIRPGVKWLGTPFANIPIQES